MAEDLHIVQGASREQQYAALYPQIVALAQGEPDFIANVSNAMAALKEAFGFFWVGCYFVKNNTLVLGPFQGPVACTRIRLGKGVCGTSWAEKRTLIVPDVDQFPGHIACSSLSKSEIVVPILNANNEVIGVLDVDSEHLNHFSEVDAVYLNKIVELIASWI